MTWFSSVLWAKASEEVSEKTREEAARRIDRASRGGRQRPRYSLLPSALGPTVARVVPVPVSFSAEAATSEPEAEPTEPEAGAALHILRWR